MPIHRLYIGQKCRKPTSGDVHGFVVGWEDGEGASPARKIFFQPLVDGNGNIGDWIEGPEAQFVADDPQDPITADVTLEFDPAHPGKFLPPG